MQIYALNSPKYVWRPAPPGPAGGAYALPQTPSRNGGLLLRGGWKGRGPTSKGQVLAANEIFLLWLSYDSTEWSGMITANVN